MRLKIRDFHLTCKVANKCLNVRERVEVVEWNKRLLLSCESPVSMKKTLIERKKKEDPLFKGAKGPDPFLQILGKFRNV